MSPHGIAILLGAGPKVGAGIARVLADPNQGNLAVALLSRNATNLSTLCNSLQKTSHGGILHAFPDVDVSSPSTIRAAFAAIRQHPAFASLPLAVAVYNPKISHRVGILEETEQQFGESLTAYVTGAMVFGQEAARWMVEQQQGEEGGGAGELKKKGTIIFTGTLGALRTNAGYAAYGAGRSSVRMLAQSMARELSGQGVHVAHVIINGGVSDVPATSGSSGSAAGGGAVGGEGGGEGEGQGYAGTKEDEAKCREGKMIRAESVGKTYLWLAGQDVDLFTHELDLRPAAEKF